MLPFLFCLVLYGTTKSGTIKVKERCRYMLFYAAFTDPDLGLGFTRFHTIPFTAAIVYWLKAANI
jgi:hypothetical protein